MIKEVEKLNYIAHIRDSDKTEQTVKQHLLDAKELAENFGVKLKIKYLAGLATLLHDFGKATPEFFDYIYTAVHDPDNARARGSVDHSTAGGKFLYDLYHQEKSSSYEKLLAEIIGNAIISHHNYLNDYLSPSLEMKYLKRVTKDIDYYNDMQDYFFSEIMSKKEFAEYVKQAEAELIMFIAKINENDFYEERPIEIPLMFLTKSIFSILIDADRTNTRLFEENKELEERANSKELFENYFVKLQDKLHGFEEKADKTPINELRQKMSQQCEDFAEKPTGIYTLSIPTGGGKTLASFRFALKHALLHDKKRIIYVVPFNTIIEQNAKEIRDIIQDDEHLLEHHSNVVFLEESDSDDFDERKKVQKKLLLAKDDWDSPIIFTSMVQFLNVFYRKGTRNIRRLHNLSDAVIIFDEAQKVPTKCISLFNEALNYLNTFMNTTAVLCTATQPTLDKVANRLNFPSEEEMIQDIDHVIESFKRVEIIDRATNNSMDTAQLAEMIIEHEQIYRSQLIILNTKKVVQMLYLEIKNQLPEVSVYHLSTAMCPAHRIELLVEIREKLKRKEKIICISTQLIEAGVDVSFESVVRSLAGLDSIAQAAGRCNRHGERDQGDVFLIDHQEENLSRLNEIAVGKEITKKILVDIRNNPTIYQGDLLSKTAIEFYFKNFYLQFKLELDYLIKNETYTHVDLLLTEECENRFISDLHAKTGETYELFFASSLQTSAKKFEVIDHLTTSMIVPFKEGEVIIADLNSAKTIEEFSSLMKKAQFYSVNIYDHDLRKLKEKQAIELCYDSIYILKEGFYSEEYGLNIEGDTMMSNLMF